MAMYQNIEMYTIAFVALWLLLAHRLRLLTRFSRGETWLLDWGCRWSGRQAGGRVSNISIFTITWVSFDQSTSNFAYGYVISRHTWGLILGSIRLWNHCQLAKTRSFKSNISFFYDNLSFIWSINIKLCGWVRHLKTRVGTAFRVSWTVKSLPTC